MNRRQARIQAVQVLYLQRSDNLSGPDALERFLGLGDELDPWAERLFRGVNERLPEIDMKIQAVSANWRLARMAWVDLSVLRLGAYELLTGTALGIVIDEAVEVARHLGDEKSPAFVNGLLDALTAPSRFSPS